MKTIKFITAMLFAVLVSAFLASAFDVSVYPILGVLIAASLFIKAPQGAFGEFLAIEATDSPETKQAKDAFNRIHADLESKGKQSASEIKEAMAGEIRALVATNAEFKSTLDTVLEQKAQMDTKFADQQEAILEINRFRSQSQANEAKGRTFEDALGEGLEANIEQLKEMAGKKLKKVSFDLKAVGTMGLSSIGGLTAANVQMAPGITPFPNRQVHLRDIIPTGRMSTSIYNFLKEIGFDGSVGVWQENSGAKPQFDIRYYEETAPSQFIAGYLKISRKALDDIPALKASLASRLLQKYLDAEDYQILNGTGADGQLSGIYAAGNSIAYTNGRTKSIEAIVDSMSVIEELNHNATDVLLRPQGYNDIMLSQSAGSTTGIYSLPGQGFVSNTNGHINIAGADVWKSTAQNANTWLTGDFKMATMLLLREDPIVEFFEQDGDNVKNNQITVRVEGRVALPIFYNDAFIHGTFVNPGS